MNVTADLALVLPALLDKSIVYFAEDDNGEQGIIFVGRKGTVAAGHRHKFNAPSERTRTI
jgi:hypothetical protein